MQAENQISIPDKIVADNKQHPDEEPNEETRGKLIVVN